MALLLGKWCWYICWFFIIICLATNLVGSFYRCFKNWIESISQINSLFSIVLLLKPPSGWNGHKPFGLGWFFMNRMVQFPPPLSSFIQSSPTFHLMVCNQKSNPYHNLMGYTLNPQVVLYMAWMSYVYKGLMWDSWF